MSDPVKGKMYIQKDGKCCRVRKLGGSLVLTPRKMGRRDGVFVKVGKSIYDGGRGVLDILKQFPLGLEVEYDTEY